MALDRAGVPADTARRFIGHDPGTTSHEDHYVHKRSATDTQGILTGGAQQSERMRYQGLEGQTYAPLTAVQAKRAEGSDDVLVTNEKLKEEAYRKLVGVHGTTKDGFGSPLYAKWEDLVQQCRLRRLRVRQMAQEQQDRNNANADHSTAFAQIFGPRQQSATTSSSTSIASPLVQLEAEGAKQLFMDRTSTDERAEAITATLTRLLDKDSQSAHFQSDFQELRCPLNEGTDFPTAHAALWSGTATHRADWLHDCPGCDKPHPAAAPR